MKVPTGNSDAYGQLLLDTHLGHNPAEIVERDDGHIDASFRMNHYATLTPLEQRILRSAHGRVLDIGCGLGRHSLFLQSRNLSVVAIDSSPLAVKIAKSRGVRVVRRLAIEDLPARLGTFQTILLMGNNLGLLSSHTKAHRILRTLDRMTSLTAQIIAETTNPYPPPDAATRAYHKANIRRGRLPGQIRIRIRYRAAATPWFDYLYTSPVELRRLLATSPWRVKSILPSTGQSYFAILKKAANNLRSSDED